MGFSLESDLVVSGVNAPTTITHAGDARIFVTEQPGRIRVFDREGNLEPGSFMNIQDRVQDAGSEQGLLGLAFPPDFCESGRFYVNYTHTASGQLVTRVSRFEIDADNPTIGDPDSEEVLMQFDQDFGNHNGGHIEFGPDGFLYISTGDGGSGGDPNNRSQDITSLLGKMLRIDVSPDTGYEIPFDNPYINDDFGQDEIWSFGLRNAWKFAFDRETGDMFIADVGQNQWEEVNFEPADAGGGLNYGWRCYEGNQNFNLSGCEAPEYVFPIVDYNHSSTGGPHCSITGGRVYRGPSFEAFQGKYFYTDLCSGAQWTVEFVSGGWDVTAYGSIGQSFITTWGEDVWGEMYFANGNGIYRVVDGEDELLDPIVQTGSVLTSLLEGANYEWSVNGQLVETGSEFQSIQVSELGTYTLIITTFNGCTIELEVLVTTLSASESGMELNFNVFPNPTNSMLTVDLSQVGIQSGWVNVYAIDGRVVRKEQLNGNLHLMDITSLSKGSYIIEAFDTEGNSLGNLKFLKN